MKRIQRSVAGRPSASVIPRPASVRGFTRAVILLAISFGLVLASCAGEATPTPTRSSRPATLIETRLTAAERAAIFEAVWQTINDKYFDPTFGGKDWQAIGDEYRRKLASVRDDDTFWKQVLNPMLWELGVSHLVALPPELGALISPMTFATGSVGMDVRLLDGAAVVTQVVEGTPADKAELRPGLVITSVDGWTLADIAADSSQTPPDNERHRQGIAIQGMRDLLVGEAGTEVVVEYLDASDRLQRVTLQLAPRTGSACAEFGVPSWPQACAEIEVRRLASGIGYLRFSGFLPAVLDGVLQAIDDLHDAPALIIDLRGNPGGHDLVQVPIASHLVGTPELYVRYRLREGQEDIYLDAVPDVYPGALVILVDEHSESSSEAFSGSLQALGRATIVGSRTPGSCLPGAIVPLPRGAVLIYPRGQAQTPDGRVLEDNGVVPDIEVALDRQQLRQGVDAQLEAAIEYLAGQMSK